MSDVRQMAWVHLKLLAARASVLQVIASAGREKPQPRRAGTPRHRPAQSATALGDELKRSLEQQLEVIRSRRSGHADAERRRELIEAEIERLRQQVSLVREQALLATDEHSAAASLDALSASLNEANRWLKDQRELFAGLDDLTDEPPPADLLRPKSPPPRAPEEFRNDESRNEELTHDQHHFCAIDRAAPPPATSSRCCCWSASSGSACTCGSARGQG